MTTGNTMSDDRKAQVSVNADDLRFALTRAEIISQEMAAAVDRLWDALSAQPSPDAPQSPAKDEARRDDWNESMAWFNSAIEDEDMHDKRTIAYMAWQAGIASRSQPTGAGRKLTRQEIDRIAAFAIESDYLPPDQWESAGLYDFAHAIVGGIGVVDDLATLVSRLVRALKKLNPDHYLAVAALGYLKRHGLEGSPLRAQPTGAADAKAKQIAPNGWHKPSMEDTP
jgi:hypothetical protein